MRTPRVAIVHERFTELGGSERVVEQLLEIWPGSTVHTTVFDPAALPPGLAHAELRASPLQRVYRGGPGYSHLLSLFPWAMSRIDVGEVDLVVASHHAFANWVRVPGRAAFISYTHTPARWMWDRRMRSLEGGALTRAALGAFAASTRRHDRRAAGRPDALVVNSRFVAGRVRDWWGRPAEVVHPPVDTDRFRPDPSVRREPFFLLAGRLVPYKRPEVALVAARRAGVRLVVAGDGRCRESLERLAGDGIELLGAVDDETLRRLYRSCTALVFPGEEDFGMVPVEAQACGTPVIALREGGVRESVVDGVTGILYRPADPGEDQAEILAEVLSGFDPSGFDEAQMRANAELFSRRSFREKVAAIAQRVLEGLGRGQESAA